MLFFFLILKMGTDQSSKASCPRSQIQEIEDDAISKISFSRQTSHSQPELHMNRFKGEETC